MRTLLPSLQPQLLHPQVKLQWKKYADIPVGMARPQAVLVREKVYVGGGICGGADKYLVFQYNPFRDEWSRLSPHSLRCFAMAHFKENLVTVGGKTNFDIVGKVYRFKEESQKWEEFLKPMPTTRFWLSVAATQSAIIASGGSIGNRFRDGKSVPCTTVEQQNISVVHC